MRVCGIDYSASDLIPIILEQHDGAEWRLVQTEPKKVTLKDIYDTGAVRLFAKTVEAFLRDNQVDMVVVKKRATKGRFAGGAASFRMGAVVQLGTEKPVTFMSPPAIAKAVKDQEHPDRNDLLAYQESSFQVAWAHSMGF